MAKKHKQKNKGAKTTPDNGKETTSSSMAKEQIQRTPKKHTNHDKPKQKKKQVLGSLWNAQHQFLTSNVSPKEQTAFFSNHVVHPDRRAEVWTAQADLGESLVNKYSWATPDAQALRILQEFSPLVEIGCGSNAYWCKCMVEAGIDVQGYDISIQQGGQIIPSQTQQPQQDKEKNSHKKKKKKSSSTNDEFQVRHGGPQILSSKDIRKSNRTLFLCYPDEDTQEDDDEKEEYGGAMSMGAACLEHYQGQYVIHVGELYGDTLSLDQAPWGRSSGSDFQQRLASEYHCILKAGLQNWLHVRDTISVWKRSEQCSIVFAADEDDEDDDEDEEVVYVHIPPDEKLPTDVAAPCVAHLLWKDPASPPSNPNDNSNDKKTSMAGRGDTSSTAETMGQNMSKKRKKIETNDDSLHNTNDGGDSADEEYTTPW